MLVYCPRLLYRTESPGNDLTDRHANHHHGHVPQHRSEIGDPFGCPTGSDTVSKPMIEADPTPPKGAEPSETSV